MVYPLFATVASMNQIVLLVILFVVTTRAWLSYVVFSISLAIGNFHEFGDGFRLLSTEFFNVGFSSDAVTESVDHPVNGDIFGNVQKFSEMPDVCAR
jgi:hypothetical protein